MNVGEVYDGWTVTGFGTWGTCPYILCQHNCGATRKFQRHEIRNSKQSCKRCEARQSYRRSAEEVILNAEYRSYKWSATKRGYEFALDKSTFFQLVKSACTYCGREPFTPKQITVKRRSVWHENEKVLLNGIDRVDNTVGYVSSNVVPCCSICNYAKRDMTLNEWKEQVTRWYTTARMGYNWLPETLY